jgi:hypothetical protein
LSCRSLRIGTATQKYHMFKFRRKIKITSKGASNKIDWGEFFYRQKWPLIAVKDFLAERKINLIAAKDFFVKQMIYLTAVNDFIGKQAKYLIIILVIALVALGIFIALKHYEKPLTQLPQIPKLIVEEAKENNLMEGKSAIELGLNEAQKWHADALLSYIISSDAGQLKGRSNNWQLIFVSPSSKGKGYQVKITDAKISDLKEISYVGQAAELPANTISQAEAVAMVRAMRGYEDVKILGIDMVYGAGVKTWYWGVKTSKGTVSIKAGEK